MEKFWKAALSVGGFGAVGAFVFYSLYNKWLSLPIFSALSSQQTFKIMIVFLILTFLAFFVILIVYLKKKEYNKSDFINLTKAGNLMLGGVGPDEKIRINKNEIQQVIPAPSHEVGKTVVVLNNDKSFNVVESVTKVNEMLK